MSKTTGTRSFARVRAEEAQKLGHDLTEVEMFYLTHKKKDGSMVDSTSAKIVENIQTIAAQRAEEQPSEPVDENHIFLEVMGKERHGRVRGYGFGPTHSSVSSKLPSQLQMASTIETLRQENKELKEKLSTVEQIQPETLSLLKSFMEEVYWFCKVIL
ncbi:uncharacterized protein LOC127814098 [Diospyros lotus]|uniref:uncharacterized protein LOC127814098 n=1 Tax=Diospyros lotus TaxID=55363 RepID=UPI00225027FC|nr:uncharacterized protein LOC127814098 [Diospyros lotus]